MKVEFNISDDGPEFFIIPETDFEKSWIRNNDISLTARLWDLSTYLTDEKNEEVCYYFSQVEYPK